MCRFKAANLGRHYLRLATWRASSQWFALNRYDLSP